VRLLGGIAKGDPDLRIRLRRDPKQILEPVLVTKVGNAGTHTQVPGSQLQIRGCLANVKGPVVMVHKYNRKARARDMPGIRAAFAHGLESLPVLDHEKGPGLIVLAALGVTPGMEDLLNYVFRNRLIRESSNRTLGANGIECIHICLLILILSNQSPVSNIDDGNIVNWIWKGN
jgi:hypothetical protein